MRSRQPASRLIFLALVLLGCGPTWVVERVQDDAGWLGVHAMGDGEAWVVGGLDADGHGAILHRTVEGWSRVASGVDVPLWWVTAASDGTLWVGGEGGTVLKGQGNTFVPVPTPSATATVFGLWTAAPDDVWMVGGDGTAGGFAWRFDGTSITPVTTLPEGLADRSTIYKVWGRAADDVFFVGSDGLALHWDGTGFTRLVTNTNSTLFTVHGNASRSLMVGGALGGAVLLEWSGGRVTDRSPAVDQLFGVASSDTLSLAVGQSRTVVESFGGAFERVPSIASGAETLHSVSISPMGQDAFAVGGVIASPPFVRGIVLHRLP